MTTKLPTVAQRRDQGLTIPQQSRSVLASATVAFRDVVTVFGDYVGPEKIASKGPKGFVMQVTNRIKKRFGAHDDQDPKVACQVAGVYMEIADILRKGMEQRHTRDAIKKAAYAAIDRLGVAVAANEETFAK